MKSHAQEQWRFITLLCLLFVMNIIPLNYIIFFQQYSPFSPRTILAFFFKENNNIFAYAYILTDEYETQYTTTKATFSGK